MTIEFTSINPSSYVRIKAGPHVPTGGIPVQIIDNMKIAKAVLFLVAVFIQLIMYVGIYCNRIAMPEDDDEDVISKNEAMLLCRGNKSSYTKTGR